ncbi:hypothetical protein FisN_6Lh347 [Fistulifera solaris]|uniref:BZIP domain-containing protein n=1 Tax=Fistulifera solaris TaxID=1519565 RepID=A0A1Z5JKQ3_FISSO|nr:hypothetical protein FisN_6Lh347 [Fistulifera solaris]|eukprot:GAX14569.1 hypothetical protein FisN_6Lh347 [Fistulifera solaris]
MPSPRAASSFTGKREKRVEFSPSLESIDRDHEQPESPHHSSAVPWDTETDHMLSYFLGGEMGHGPTPMFSTANPNSSKKYYEDDEDAPPTTPAVPYFYAGAHRRNNNKTESLQPMAASLITGGPMVTSRQILRQSSSTHTMDSLENPSPISPAALIGNAHENLMLPHSDDISPLIAFQRQQMTSSSDAKPMAFQQTMINGPEKVVPPPSSNGETLYPRNTETSQQQQQHMAWLQEINARAKMSGPSATSTQFVPPPMPMQPVMAYFPHPHFMAQHPYLFAATMAQQQDSKTPVESEEKRVKRLERNRESARKSRRRKKERLETLEAKVNHLHEQIENERKTLIHVMIQNTKSWRCAEIEKGQVPSEQVVRYTSPFSPMARAVTEFQYNRLRQVTLPGYHKFLLWCVSREDDFYTSAREQYVKRVGNSGGANRSSANKISSKQIGEELFNAGTKVEEKEDRQFPASSFTDDYEKTWPLICFEMKFSVDQEEKFMACRKKAREIPNLDYIQSETTTAVRTVESLSSAVESVSYAVGRREEASLNSILTPAQTAAYQGWLTRNRSKCHQAFNRAQGDQSPLPAADTSEAGVNPAKDTSLVDICRRLNEVLRISKPQ